MRFDFNRVLREKIYALQAELALSNFEFEVDSEQAFIKDKDLAPNVIYVLTRNLQNDNSIGVDTQPVQILILTEQNSLDISKALFSEFAKRYNFEAISENYTEDGETHNIWVKQQYSDPVVLSNFNTVDFGYRSVLYVSATLYIMYDVVDVKNVTIDTKSYTPLNFSVSYSMSTNTQQLPSKYIATSVKTVSTFAITMTVPPVKSDLITKVTKIIAGNYAGFEGNEDFVISFDLGLGTAITKNMKLISVQEVTAPNSVPGLQLGFLE